MPDSIDIIQQRSELVHALPELLGTDAAAQRWREDVVTLLAEVERLTLADQQWADHVKRVADERDELRAENRWLRARLCYVNPDGSHVRGCAQHEAQHPAQWCESLAKHNCG